MTRRVAFGLILLVGVSLLPACGEQREAWVLEPGPRAYRGLGTWVDIFEAGVWNDPEAAVAEMADRGVLTLYLQTSNYSRADAIVHPEATGRLLDAAHDAGIHVVAWHLPGLIDLKADVAAARAAIEFRSPNGDGFDSFAPDIEAREIRDIDERNAALLRYSREVRAFAGADYPLGAITPNPMRIAHERGYWPGFPYGELSIIYDAFVPMNYFGAVPSAGNKSGAFRYTREGIHLIREGSVNPGVPIHVIAGLAQDVTGPELRGYLKAVSKGGAIGWSVYNFTRTGEADWEVMQAGPPPRSLAS